MAFAGRGGSPSMGGGPNRGGIRHYRRHFRRYYYIPLDNTYFTIQLLTTLLILGTAVVAYIVTYKSKIVDPIEEIKKSFINAQLVTILLLLTMMLISNFFSKTKKALLKKLTVILTASIITMLVFLGIKLNLDMTYTNSEFDKLYEKYSTTSESSNSEKKISVGLDGIKMVTEKQFYINECVKLYDIFKMKTYGILVLHLVLTTLLVYQVIKVKKFEEKNDRLNRDDIVLLDEEDNVTM